MKAIILAGGRGERLTKVTHGAYPKPMAELLGRPLMEHTLRHLRRCGFTEVCCSLGCMPEQIMTRFGDGSTLGVKLTYRVEETPLGTAGGVKNCRDFYGSAPFLVISGDAALDLPLDRLASEHERRQGDVTMALYPHETPLPYGLAVTDREDLVRFFLEKPRWGQVVTDLVNTGIYVLSPAVMEEVPDGQPFDFARDLFPKLLREGKRIIGLPLSGYWRDIGDPGSYYRANLDAWEGRLHLPDGEETPASEPERELPESYACRIYLTVPHRARLMRALTADLMEMGADLTHGLTVSKEPGGIHIAPCAHREALAIESDDPATARKYEALARHLAGEIE